MTKKSIIRLLHAFPDTVKLFDVNLRKAYFDADIISSSLEQCTVFKLNDSEVGILSPMLFGQTLDVGMFSLRALKDFPCQAVVITLGGNGAAGYEKNGNTAFVPGITANVVDTVGAGDAFSAAFLASWLNTHDLQASLSEGNAAGARTVAHAGAVPE